MFETLLFPLNKTRQAIETFGKVLELAKNYKSRVILLSVLKTDADQTLKAIPDDSI